MAALVKTIKIEGLKELDRALGELTKATARNVLKRVLVKAGEPIAQAARNLAPVDSGELRDSIQVSSRIKNTIGAAEFAAVLRAGGTRQEAGAALRAARRSSGPGSFAEVHVGPAQAKTKADAIKRIVQEFGSINNPAQPYMRPAWAQEQNHALDIVKAELGGEIIKTAKRIAARAAAKAAKVKP